MQHIGMALALNGTYSNLPNEVQKKILHLLPQQDLMLGAALVSRSWCRIARVVLQRRRSVRLSGWSLRPSGAVQLIEWMLNLRKVHLVNWDQWAADSLVCAIAANHPNLEELDMDNVFLYAGKPLEQVAENCSRLKAVRMETCGIQSSMHPLDIFAISANLEKIALDVYGCHIQPLDKFIVRKWSRLAEVDLCCRHGHLFDRDKAMEVIACTVGVEGLLKKLRVGNLEMTDSYEYVGYCYNLEELDLPTARSIPQDILTAVFTNMKRLRQLSLGTSWMHTPNDPPFRGMQENVGQLNPKMEYATYYENLNNASVAFITIRCPGLTHLAISCCRSFTNRGLLELVVRCSNLQLLHLERGYHLDLSEDARRWFSEINPGLHICTMMNNIAPDCMTEFLTSFQSLWLK